MESRLRHWVAGPAKILRGADILPGQRVLEVGCGPGFYTVSAARLIGDQGNLLAIDVLSDYVEQTSQKVQAAKLANVQVEKRDALETGLDAETIDTVLLFSVIPSPTVPLVPLLTEMHRILKPNGVLAVTTFPWLIRSIRRSELFTFVSKRNGVFNFRRS